nr:Dihydrofolate reductase [uncultured bacterium]
MNPKISIIVAMDEKRGIGKENTLMWKIPGELKRFKEITTGHPIIMGRKTFDSIGRVLPGRTNIIITRDIHYVVDGAVVVHSLEEALKKAKGIDAEEIFVIGGGQIFQQALPQVDRLYLTLVQGDFSADTFFPDYSAFTKKISEEQKEAENYKFTFLTLDK